MRVLGTTDDLPEILREQRPDEVLIAIPSAPGSVRAKVVEMARRESIPVKTLPGLHELIAGDVDLAVQIRPVQVEDVLGREPVEVDLEADRLVPRRTRPCSSPAPAARSAPSSAARSPASARPGSCSSSTPRRALFEIERELVAERNSRLRVPVLADVGNRAKLRQVFERYRPAVVFHAAAYKHVPLMEANPLESVRNNTLGTRTVADVAVEFGPSASCSSRPTRRSNPKNVMGQSKARLRVDRRGVRAPRRRRRRGSSRVRFGNVLGSRAA